MGHVSQEFDFVIEHRSGNKMRYVDALSRFSCLMSNDPKKHKLKQAQMQHNWIKDVRNIFENGNYKDFYLKHDLVYNDKDRKLMVIPESTEEEIIRIAHRKGHFGTRKTRELLESEAKFYTQHCIEN